MELARLELRRVRLALVTPVVSAHGTETDREVILVRAEGPEGTAGWGECPTLARPTYTSEYTGGAWAVMRDHLAPALVTGPRLKAAGHRMAHAALLDAMLALACEQRSAAEALSPMFGEGPPRDTVPTTTVIGQQADTGALVARVGTEVEAGSRWVKVKVDPGSLGMVRAVRACWSRRDLDLAVDANGSLDPADHGAMELLDGLDLAYLEQPFPAEDLAASARWAGQLTTPIALDESITSLGSLQSALSLGALGVLNAKPARLGGFMATAPVVRLARSAGIDVFVGGMLETGVGRAVALAAAAQPACTLPTDLGPSGRYFAEDLTEPFSLNPDGTLTVPAGPGFGVEPDPDRLERATVDRAVFERPG